MDGLSRLAVRAIIASLKLSGRVHNCGEGAESDTQKVVRHDADAVSEVSVAPCVADRQTVATGAMLRWDQMLLLDQMHGDDVQSLFPSTLPD